MEVPIGTVVSTYSRDVYHGRRGRCSVSFGVAIEYEGKAMLVECPHRTLRSRPVYSVTLPNGAVIEIGRRA